MRKIRILKAILSAVFDAIRGTAEALGGLVMFVTIVGRTVNGEWALGNLINGTVEANGIVLSVLFIFMLFVIGAIWKRNLDGRL